MPGSLKILAIDASSPVLSVAAANGSLLAQRSESVARLQSRHVYLLVQEVLEEAGLELASLDCLAFGCGPGGFTGLRVAAAVAQALAFGCQLPVCRVSSLEILAWGAARNSTNNFFAASLDARMGEIYLGCYEKTDAGLKLFGVEQLLAPANIADANLPDAGVHAVGAGWAAYPDLRQSLTGRIVEFDDNALPLARDLIELAEMRYQNEDLVTATDALPNYLRDKVAQR